MGGCFETRILAFCSAATAPSLETQPRVKVTPVILHGLYPRAGVTLHTGLYPQTQHPTRGARATLNYTGEGLFWQPLSSECGTYTTVTHP